MEQQSETAQAKLTQLLEPIAFVPMESKGIGTVLDWDGLKETLKTVSCDQEIKKLENQWSTWHHLGLQLLASTR
eukprot:4852566-Alexandrium_andersonii.AAC.1